MELIEYLQAPWVWRAIMASSLVGIMCGVLGCFIVLRNMAMIGDALSHAILPGVVVAFVIFGYSIAGFFLGSVFAGLLTAVIITWVQQKIKTKNDAAIGIIFTAMFSLGIIGISYISKNEGVHLDLKDFLFGNILGVSNEDLYLTLAVSIYVIFSIWYFYRYFFITTFQPTIAKAMGIPIHWVHYLLMILLSFAVVASLQTVGVILVVAMLITPASSALMWSDKLVNVLWISAFLGLLSSILGFLMALIFDTTPGPAMAIMATIIYFFSAMVAPNKGLIPKYIKKQRLKTRILREDILKLILQTHRRTSTYPSLKEIAQSLEKKASKIKSEVSYLISQGLINKTNGEVKLTNKGTSQSLRLVRAHRLWETYLVNEIGLDDTQIHKSAEDQEHHMTDEFIDEVDRTLGYPATDPHGSPIPKITQVRRSLVLSDLKVGDKAYIAESQFHQDALRFLLTEHILGNQEVRVKEMNDARETLTLESRDRDIIISYALAHKIELLSEVDTEA